MRMFAGPNGSGKSTLHTLLRPDWVGVYINPDMVEDGIRRNGSLDMRMFGVAPPESRFRQFLEASTLLQRESLVETARGITFHHGCLDFASVTINAYLASVITDFLRTELLSARVSFTFETVMSSPTKLSFMEAARRAGYRVYLYFIATDDPQINLSRVANRVLLGGHDVPSDKVVSRYHRSLDLLDEAIARSDRAYLFDNSGDLKERVWIAEVTHGHDLVLRTNSVPAWFQRAVLSKHAVE